MASEIDLINLVPMVKSATEEALKELGHVNIVIAGRSGVGKSTLVNAVFQSSLAPTGEGRPVTQEIREYQKEGFPLSLWDVPGVEMAQYKATTSALVDLVKERKKNSDSGLHLHTAWLCIAEDLRRVEVAETEIATALAEHMPVIAVITKARSNEGFDEKVRELVPTAKHVVRVRAKGEELDEGYVLSPMGLDRLVSLTDEVIPEGQRLAFAAAQKVSVQLKAAHARQAVNWAVGAATGIGGAPVPFADAAMLVPTQVAMLAKISADFGINVDQVFLTTLVPTVLGVGGATLLGRTIVANLFKMFPGVGSVVGGVISAATAAALTKALGEAYISALSKLFEQNGGEPPSSATLLDAVKSEFSQRRSAAEVDASPSS